MRLLRALNTVLRYTWALPWSLVGILLALPAMLSGATVRITHGAVEVAGGWIGACAARLPRPLGFTAITFGHVILGVSHGQLTRFRRHEHVHVRQYERWGPFFIPLYLGSSAVQLLRGRNPYYDNCFEREAFEADAASAP
jgi:hypothetical protein